MYVSHARLRGGRRESREACVGGSGADTVPRLAPPTRARHARNGREEADGRAMAVGGRMESFEGFVLLDGGSPFVAC